MSLIKWNPESGLSNTFSRWMDDFFDDNGNWFAPTKSVSIPAVNVKENKNAFKMEVAAPGFKKDDFKLEIQNGNLVISGESREEKEEKDEKFTRQEYRYSSFNRLFTLPENVNGEAISAEYQDGILKVILPKKKTEEKPVKQIAVN